MLFFQQNLAQSLCFVDTNTVLVSSFVINPSPSMMTPITKQTRVFDLSGRENSVICTSVWLIIIRIAFDHFWDLGLKLTFLLRLTGRVSHERTESTALAILVGLTFSLCFCNIFEWWPSYLNTLEITDRDLRVTDDTNWLLSDKPWILLFYLTMPSLCIC